MADVRELADQIIKGGIDAYLLDQRDRLDRSFDAIAIDLGRRGITVSRETVRRWLDLIDTPTTGGSE